MKNAEKQAERQQQKMKINQCRQQKIGGNIVMANGLIHI
jgi:hypothetical protein